MSSLLDSFDEDLITDDYQDDYSETDYVEDFNENSRRRHRQRPVGRIPAGVRRAANYQNSNNGSINARLTADINELKKASLSLSKSVQALDKRYEEVTKIVSRKDKQQDSTLRNIQMQSILGTMLSQPKLRLENLKITQTTPGGPFVASEDSNKKVLEIDQTLSLLLALMPSMSSNNSSGGIDNNMATVLPLLFLGNNNNNNNIALPLVMMMMMGGMNNTAK